MKGQQQQKQRQPTTQVSVNLPSAAPNNKSKELGNALPTTPFTFNELQSLSLEDSAFKKYLKKDGRSVSCMRTF